MKKKLIDPDYDITLKLKLSLKQFQAKSLLVTTTWQTWQLMRCSHSTLLQSHNVLDWKDKIQFFLMEDPFKTVFMINLQEEVEWLNHLLK